MRHYGVFGGVLASEIPLPGLPAAPAGPADWTVRVSGPSRRLPDEALLGQEILTPEVSVALHGRSDGGLRLGYRGHGIGEFHLSADGSRIDWTPGPNPPLDRIGWILLGRVMALSLHLAGRFSLHASGVAVEGGAICFVAPKHHGKSALAAALVAAGASLAGDDLLPVDLGATARIRPGVHALRLWASDADRTRTGLGRFNAVPAGKAFIDGLPGDRVMRGPTPLRAVYVLEPCRDEPEPGEAVTATRLAPMPAFEALVRHSPVARLLGPRKSCPLLTRASALARAVPVHTLRIVRDLDRLPEVVDRLLEWHSGRPLAVHGPSGDAHAWR